MWLAGASRCSLTEVGVEGVIDFTLAAIAACGGMARAVEAPRTAPVNGDEHRFDRPTPFLEQHRAFSSLRHELDRLAADLEGGDTEFAPERIPEVLTLPNRLIVRIGTTGLSFSWLSGGTVAEGRLLVIEWSGMQPAARGVTPLKSAVALRERVYRPEAAGPDGWRWRADDPNGCAYSTAHLAAEWLFAASIATSA